MYACVCESISACVYVCLNMCVSGVYSVLVCACERAGREEADKERQTDRNGGDGGTEGI